LHCGFDYEWIVGDTETEMIAPGKFRMARHPLGGATIVLMDGESPKGTNLEKMEFYSCS